MYKRNIQGLLCNHCCSGKPIRVTLSERVFVALVMQYVKRMHLIVVYGLSGSKLFFNHIS